MINTETPPKRPLLFAMGGASPDLLARVRNAVLGGWYRPAGPDGWPGLKKPDHLRIGGMRYMAMRMSERLDGSPLTAWLRLPSSSIPFTGDTGLMARRYAHVSWKPGIHAYPEHADSLGLVRRVMSSPTLDGDQTKRLLLLMEDLTGLALDDPAMSGPGCGRGVGLTLGTPWSRPLVVSTDVDDLDVDGHRDRNIPFVSSPIDPHIAGLLPTIIKAEEWSGGPGTNIMLTPMTVLTYRSGASGPLEVLRALDALRRDPFEDHAVPA